MYQIPELKKFPELVHAFSTKEQGNMSFFWGSKSAVLKNRERFLSQLGTTLDSCAAFQVQNKAILTIVNNSFAGIGMRNHENAVIADGLITKEKNLYLFLLTADCIPIILFDLKKRVLALIHAGWKSTETRIAFKTIKKLTEELDCNIADIYAAIGPAIHKNSYIFKDPIQKQLTGWKTFLKDLPDGNTAIDLIGYNKKQLEDAEINPQNIFVSKINTAQDSNFFSHYRDSRESSENEGRFACVAGLIHKER